MTNTGNAAGKEIAQLYIEPVESPVYRPSRELKAFAKVDLRPGETKTVTFLLNDRSFAIWQEGWKVPAGRYRIGIGADCQDIRLSEEMERDGEEWCNIMGDAHDMRVEEGLNATHSNTDWCNIAGEASDIHSNEDLKDTAVPSWYKRPKGTPGQASFEELIGRKILEPVLKKGAFTMENTVMEMKDHAWIMRIMFKAVEATIAKGFGGKADYNNPEFRMMIYSSADCSLSGMKINGAMKNHVLEGMLEMANGHYLRGLCLMIKGSL